MHGRARIATLKRTLSAAAGLLACLLTLSAHAEKLQFLPVAAARHALAARDVFITRMSPFDRSARMKRSRAVSVAQFQAFVASAAKPWAASEKKRIKVAFGKILPAVRKLGLPLPDTIQLVRTSGREEGDAVYTRGQAIFLPDSAFTLPDHELKRLLAHELFHLATRAHPELARRMYAVIGFHYCGEVALPAELRARKITNPDAPHNDYYITLQMGAHKVFAIPILYSRTQKYDTARGGDFFDYLQLGFLLVEPGKGAPRVLRDAQGPRLVTLGQVSGDFFGQVGRNTDYVIHPEEILADNFALLALGEKDVPSPDILTRMRRVLAQGGWKGAHG